MHAIIDEHDLPAHTVGFGVKGAVTWSPTPVRNYRDYKRDRLRRRRARGCGASTAASSPRPGSTSSGSCRSPTRRDDMGLLVAEFRELAEALRG